METWIARLKRAQEVKRRYFQEEADRLWGALTRSYSEVWIVDFPDPIHRRFYSSVLHPTAFRPRFNKCREFVSLYLPFVVARAPTRVVLPRRPTLTEHLRELIQINDLAHRQATGQPLPCCLNPEIESAASLLEWYLNYTAQELDLESELRMAVIEALVKGRGILWHELVTHNGRLTVGSFFDSVDRLLIDGDTVFLRDAAWIARMRVVPAWWVREAMRLPEDIVRKLPRAESITTKPDDLLGFGINTPRAINLSNQADTVWFYEIFSRIGLGTQLLEDEIPDALKIAFDALGQYCYLVIAPGVDHPLNMIPDQLVVMSSSEIQAKVSWPLFIGAEINDPWPCSILDFYPACDNPWASSPLEPGIVFQFFLDLLYGYVMNRAAASARIIVAVAEDLPEEAVEGLLYGKDLEIVRIPRHEIRDLAAAIAPIPLPEVSPTLWSLIQAVERQFERAVGLDPLLYGAAQVPQPRSATEILTREKYLTSRPDDMADRVERWCTRIAQKEAVATRLYIRSSEVAPLFCETVSPLGPLSQFWDEWVAVDNPNEAASEFQYGVEAGSGRRRNREYLAAVAQLALQQLGPIAMQALTHGNPVPFNKLIRFMARSLEADFNEFLITREEMAQIQRAAQARAQKGTVQQEERVGVNGNAGTMPL